MTVGRMHSVLLMVVGRDWHTISHSKAIVIVLNVRKWSDAMPHKCARCFQSVLEKVGFALVFEALQV